MDFFCPVCGEGILIEKESDVESLNNKNSEY